MPDSLKLIDRGAFANNQINNLDLGKSVETINDGAFYKNNLASVTIPSSVKTLYPSFDLNQLKSVTIGTDSFSGSPEMVLKEGAFSGCWSDNTFGINTLTIGKAVKTIENGAFTCNSLTSLKIDSNPTFGTGVFAFNGLDRSTVPADLNDAQTYDYYKDNAELVKIYASDPSFAYKSEYFYSPETDSSGDNTYSDIYVAPIVSGTIVNPASYTVYYKTDEKVSLAKSKTYISKNSLTNYKISNTLDATNPTSPNLSFDPYYKLGDIVTSAVPSFAGYESPDQSQIMLVRGAANNNNSLVYIYEDINKSVPAAPNTGLTSTITKNPIIIAVLGLLASVMVIVVRRRVG